MRISSVTNSDLIIQANMRKPDDLAAVKRITKHIADESQGVIVIASSDEREGWVHLTACWDNYQKADFKEAYRSAKNQLGELK